MPFPSTGCRTCKVRRIKCDEGRPICQRCIKSHRMCSPMEVGPIVHIENQYANGRHKRPRGPRSVSMVNCSSAAILQRPSADLMTSAMFYYLHNHLRTPKDTPDILKGVADNFLPMRMSVPKCPPILDLAISSIALAVFSRTQKYPAAAIESWTKYCQLLHVAQVTVSSPLDQQNINASLLAIFFMSRYENVVHQPTSPLCSTISYVRSLKSFSHHDGALAILKVWKDRLSHFQTASDVIKHTRRSLIKSTLLRNLPIPEWMVDGSIFGECGYELEYDRVVVQVTDLRQRLSVLLEEIARQQHSSHELTSTAETLSKEASDLNKALQDWKVNSLANSCPRRHTLPNLPAKDFYSSTIYSYSTPAHAAIWILYYSVRLLIDSTRLRALEFIRSNPDDLQRLECLSNIKTIANDLASSLPFCLQRFQVMKISESCSDQDLITLNKGEDLKPSIAELTAWPLTICSSIRVLDSRQKSWFRIQLASFGRMIGDRVLEFDDADRWLQL